MLKALASLLWIRKPHSCLTCAFYLLCTKEAPEAAWPTSFQGSLGNGCSQTPARSMEVLSHPKWISHIFIPITIVLSWEVLANFIFSLSLHFQRYFTLRNLQQRFQVPCPPWEGWEHFRLLDCHCCREGGRELVVAVWQTPKTPNAVCPASIPVSSAKSLLIFLWEMLILHSQFMGLKGHVSQKWHSNWIRETQVTLARPGGSGCLWEPSGDGNSSCGVC